MRGVRNYEPIHIRDNATDAEAADAVVAHLLGPSFTLADREKRKADALHLVAALNRELARLERLMLKNSRSV